MAGSTTYLYAKVKFAAGWKAGAYTSDIIVPAWFSGGDATDPGNYFWINAVQAAGQIWADGHGGLQGFMDWWSGDILYGISEDQWYEVETKTVTDGSSDGFGSFIYTYELRIDGETAVLTEDTPDSGFGVQGNPTNLLLGAYFEYNASGTTTDDHVYFEKVAYCTDDYFKDGGTPIFFYDFIPGTVDPPFDQDTGTAIVTAP